MKQGHTSCECLDGVRSNLGVLGVRIGLKGAFLGLFKCTLMRRIGLCWASLLLGLPFAFLSQKMCGRRVLARIST